MLGVFVCLGLVAVTDALVFKQHKRRHHRRSVDMTSVGRKSSTTNPVFHTLTQEALVKQYPLEHSRSGTDNLFDNTAVHMAGTSSGHYVDLDNPIAGLVAPEVRPTTPHSAQVVPTAARTVLDDGLSNSMASHYAMTQDHALLGPVQEETEYATVTVSGRWAGSSLQNQYARTQDHHQLGLGSGSLVESGTADTYDDGYLTTRPTGAALVTGEIPHSTPTVTSTPTSTVSPDAVLYADIRDEAWYNIDGGATSGPRVPTIVYVLLNLNINCKRVLMMPF